MEATKIKKVFYLKRFHYTRGVGSSPAGPVLAGPLLIKVKTKFHFAKSK